MAQPGLIADYHAALLAELPASLAEEVCDGLDDAYSKYLRRGLTARDAASAAVAEFGDARAVADGFTRASPARRASRALIVTGPLVGACWAAELVTGRAWAWHVPVVAPLLMGAVLAVTVAMLGTAVLGGRYRQVRRSGAAACAGLAALDVSMITVVAAVAPSVSWLASLAMCMSAARFTAVIRLAGRMLG